MSASPRDAIVIGGGLNGLTCAAYLAKHGLKVLVLERRDVLGGTAVTEEFAPGFRVDTVRHDIGHVSPRIYRDLSLERHGLKLLSGAPTILAPALDGSALWLGGTAPGEPSESLKRLSPADAAKWPEFTRQVRALAGFLDAMYRAPVPGVDASTVGDFATMARLALRLRRLGKKDMVEVLRVLPMSIAEWLDDTFENPLLKGVIASRGIMHLCQGPRAAGTAFNFLHHQVGRHQGSLRSSVRPMDGVGSLGAALAAAARASGAEIRTGTAVARILVKGGRAAGVVLASGEEIAARRIVSGASPRHTFLELCDPSQLQPELVRAVDNIRYKGVWAKVNLALDGLPAFRGERRDDAKLTRSVVIAPSMDYLERAYDDAKYGRVSVRPYLDIYLPTVTADDQAPQGRHVMSVHVQYAPYHLREGAWDAAARERLGDLVVKTVAEYAPELPNLVRHRQVLTPKDLEDRFGLPEGHAYHGEIALDQALFMRPVPECARYATPVPGLYLCGSGSHPGGAVPGQAGANAAREIIARTRG